MVMDKIADQGMLEEWMGNAKGNFNNPGFEIQNGLLFVTRVRAIGVNGSIEGSAGGGGTGLAPGTREVLLEQLKEPNLSAEQVAAILAVLYPGSPTATPLPPGG